MKTIYNLLEAILEKDTQKTKELIQAGVNVNNFLEDRDTVLITAVNLGSIDIVKMLVEAGADVNVIGWYGDNALTSAFLEYSQELVDYLMPLTSPEVQNWAMSNALLSAAADRNPEIVNLLSRYGAYLNVQNEDDGITALMIATEFRNAPFVETLVKAGANVNLKDYQGRTALMLAARFRTDIEERKVMRGTESFQLDTIKILSNRGADLDARDNQGRTALSLAADFGAIEVVKLLLELGADPNIRDDQGKTALEYTENLYGLLPYKKEYRRQVIELLKEATSIE